MSTSSRASDTVSLRVPLKAEYVSIVRLTASGIANNAGFDFDMIEDIKVAISEVIGKVIEKTPDNGLTIEFDICDCGLTIRFMLPEGTQDLFGEDADDFALAIIQSLMDETDMQQSDKNVITMVKKLGKAV